MRRVCGLRDCKRIYPGEEETSDVQTQQKQDKKKRVSETVRMHSGRG